ncbi:MAG: DUF192 domain-containing protein [Deferribacteraceae bacterium]|jgi:uncharacterized membrane protein (UPF0127 family)|nr:DUF192 domain-containing protein [Deferribacteraceae bacterium]
MKWEIRVKRLSAAVFALLCVLSAGVVSASEEVSIVVGRCNIDVIVMKTPAEQAKGMLGYTERTFPYGGMLFEMNSKGRKLFHTMGMQMPIRIMGVMQQSSGSYRVVTGAIKAPPGIQAIPIDAPDVLELPETKYQLWYKKCLMAGDVTLP